MSQIRITKQYFKFPKRNQKYIWIKGNKDKISVSDMSTQHIKNTLRILESKGKQRIKFPRGGRSKTAWKRILKDELLLR